MPIYKYECISCGNTVTKLQKISDSYPVVSCCTNVELRRIIGGANFSLAGGGWYKDGYQRSSEKEKSKE